MQAEHIDSNIVRRNALAVKRINAADFAKKMAGSPGMKLIFG
jgi:hypothetical protein